VTLIYGVLGDRLIFVEEQTARELAALWRAKTWGELKRKAPPLRRGHRAAGRGLEDANWRLDDEEVQRFRLPRNRNPLGAHA